MKKAMYLMAAAAITMLASCGGKTDKAADSASADSAATEAVAEAQDPEQQWLEKQCTTLEEMAEKTKNVHWNYDKAKYITPQEVELVCDYLIEIYPKGIEVLKNKTGGPSSTADQAKFEGENPMLPVFDKDITLFFSKVEGLTEDQQAKVKKANELRMKYAESR